VEFSDDRRQSGQRILSRGLKHHAVAILRIRHQREQSQSRVERAHGVTVLATSLRIAFQILL